MAKGVEASSAPAGGVSFDEELPVLATGGVRRSAAAPVKPACWTEYQSKVIPGHNTEGLWRMEIDDCKEACAQRDWCKSFDYHHGDKRCDLSDKNRHEVALFGNHLFTHYERRPCNECWTEYQSKVIPGHNTEGLWRMEIDECKEACQQRDWCKSFDYHHGDKRCDLSDKNRHDVALHGNDLFTHYESRPCNTCYTSYQSTVIPGHNTEGLWKMEIDECKEACVQRDWCKSFDYNHDNRRCDLSDKNRHDVALFGNNLFTHYEARPCHMCFTSYESKVIPGHNTEGLWGLEISGCKEACQQRDWCKSFDYNHDNMRCDLSDKNRHDVALHGNELFTHYEARPCNECWTKYQSKVIPGHNTEGLWQLTISGCKEACKQRDWCKSFDYHHGDRRCDLSDKNMHEVALFGNHLFTHYEATPCDECWTEYQSKVIPGHNTEGLWGLMVSGCKEACQQRDWCKSFDYNHDNRRCDLSDKNRHDVALFGNDLFTHYEFSCDGPNRR